MNEVQEFSNDGEYFDWIHRHPDGFILSLRPRKGPLLHRSTCLHIDRHNNPGALTERGTRKICAETKEQIRAWLRSELPDVGIVLPKCPTCSP